MIYKDQLEAVYRLIEKPENWTKEYFARNDDGDPILKDYQGGPWLSDEEQATHPDAACWCLYGAAYKCGISEHNDLAYSSALGLRSLVDVADFNDKHSHSEVLALLKSAIERAPVRHD